MKILSMTATFGQLEHATLTLEPGLNIIEAPNEWGKSTWCAFVAAMLYGIDSRAHSATKSGLADKTRYEPWSGQLMSGRMELVWKGRAITLERGSTKRAAFRQFRAYETDTGLPIGELTAENCGEVLLGVEKEVFLRSAFIRLSDLPVTQNEALRRRLNALVTTGDESSAGDLLADKLNKLKNEIRANRSHGLLPQAQAQKQAITEKLERLRGLQTEFQQLTAQQAHLETLLQAQNASEAARVATAQRLQQLRQDRAAREAALNALSGPALPQAFACLSPEEGHQLVKADQRAYAKLRSRQSGLSMALSLLPLAGLLGLMLHHWAGWVLAGLGAAAAVILFFLQLRAGGKAKSAVKALAEKYQGLAPGEWPDYLNRLLREQEAFENQQREAQEELSELERTIRLLEQTLTAPVGSGELIRQLQQLQGQLGRCQGRMEGLGAQADLEARLSRCEGRIRELTDKLWAIELALATLQEAKQQLQRRFAPRITGRAKALFGRMTGGRYDRLSLSEDLSVQTATAQEDILRGSLWRSEGTVDQLYLALRLAVSSELMPGAPLVLDDALVRFDDNRLKLALEVLQEEAENRQVILFTCQSREKSLLNQ